MKPFTEIFHKIINKSYQLIIFDSPNTSLLYTILYVWRNPILFLQALNRLLCKYLNNQK